MEDDQQNFRTNPQGLTILIAQGTIKWELECQLLELECQRSTYQTHLIAQLQLALVEVDVFGKQRTNAVAWRDSPPIWNESRSHIPRCSHVQIVIQKWLPRCVCGKWWYLIKRFIHPNSCAKINHIKQSQHCFFFRIPLYKLDEWMTKFLDPSSSCYYYYYYDDEVLVLSMWFHDFDIVHW